MLNTGRSARSQRCLSPTLGGYSHLQGKCGGMMGWTRVPSRLAMPSVTHLHSKTCHCSSLPTDKVQTPEPGVGSPCYSLFLIFQPHLLLLPCITLHFHQTGLLAGHGICPVLTITACHCLLLAPSPALCHCHAHSEPQPLQNAPPDT